MTLALIVVLLLALLALGLPAAFALGIAGANVLDEVKLSIPNSVVRFAETHPKDDAEVAGQVASVLAEIRKVAEAN